MAKTAKPKVSPHAQAVNDLTRALCALMGYDALVVLASFQGDRSVMSAAYTDEFAPAMIPDFVDAAMKQYREEHQLLEPKPGRKPRTKKGEPRE